MFITVREFILWLIHSHLFAGCLRVCTTNRSESNRCSMCSRIATSCGRQLWHLLFLSVQLIASRSIKSQSIVESSQFISRWVTLTDIAVNSFLIDPWSRLRWNILTDKVACHHKFIVDMYRKTHIYSASASPHQNDPYTYLVNAFNSNGLRY